jgi:hypothetical protein
MKQPSVNFGIFLFGSLLIMALSAYWNSGALLFVATAISLAGLFFT